MVAIIAVLIIDSQISGSRSNYWLPTGIAMGIVGGGVMGLLFAEVWMGGRTDEADTSAAKAASRPADDASKD
jgi:hypothetical protein